MSCNSRLIKGHIHWKIMIHGDNLERIEELVNKGISFQREGKHKEAIICFDKAINIDKEMNEEADSNLLLLKKNSEMKIDRDE